MMVLSQYWLTIFSFLIVTRTSSKIKRSATRTISKSISTSYFNCQCYSLYIDHWFEFSTIYVHLENEDVYSFLWDFEIFSRMHSIYLLIRLFFSTTWLNWRLRCLWRSEWVVRQTNRTFSTSLCHVSCFSSFILLQILRCAIKSLWKGGVTLRSWPNKTLN